MTRAATIARLRACAAALALLAFACNARAAGPASEVHGSSDAYAGSGVTLAWAVLRGSDEASTRVVLRVALDPAIYPELEVTGVDPFTKATRPLRARSAATATLDVSAPRAQFAEWPRTELRFYAAGMPARDVPALLVYYQGVPDTAPEFTSEARLSSYLDERLARARRDAQGKPP